jgi:hypothetical protein
MTGVSLAPQHSSCAGIGSKVATGVLEPQWAECMAIPWEREGKVTEPEEGWRGFVSRGNAGREFDLGKSHWQNWEGKAWFMYCQHPEWPTWVEFSQSTISGCLGVLRPFPRLTVRNHEGWLVHPDKGSAFKIAFHFLKHEQNFFQDRFLFTLTPI